MGKVKYGESKIPRHVKMWAKYRPASGADGGGFRPQILRFFEPRNSKLRMDAAECADGAHACKANYTRVDERLSSPELLEALSQGWIQDSTF